MKLWTLLFLLISIPLAVACKEDDPDESGGSDGDTDGDVDRDMCWTDASDSYVEEMEGCAPAATDYTPADPAGDTWDACISDDNTYHRIEESISSIARVEAYDAIGELLWNNPVVPSAEDFLDARILLDAEEGLGSRVDRRYDVHYEPPSDGSACDEEGVAAANPDYCVGPGILRPIINEAFADANENGNQVANAEVIHAALQWFLYVSAIKESTTCATAAKDCDSAWAYYSGGTARSGAIGLAAEIMDVTPTTHDRAYDGVLAVRCWRDLDAGETAADLDLRDQAITQYDVALLQGMAVMVRQRFVALADCADSEEAEAAAAALEVLVPLFDRALRERDSSAADLVLTEMGKPVANIDTAVAIDAIDSVFQCP